MTKIWCLILNYQWSLGPGLYGSRLRDVDLDALPDNNGAHIIRKLRELSKTTKYIMDRVKSMKHDLMSASIHDEHENVEESDWVSYMQELRLDNYN